MSCKALPAYTLCRSQVAHRRIVLCVRRVRVAQAYDTEELQAIIDAGADVNFVNSHGCTALGSLVHRGFRYGGNPSAAARTVQLLLAAGAEYSLGWTDRGTCPGMTELHWACHYADAACVQLLLCAGASVLAAGRCTCPASFLLDGETPLGSACGRADLEKMKLLCVYGAPRADVGGGISAEEQVARGLRLFRSNDEATHEAACKWLELSSGWQAPADCLDQLLTPERTRELLRGGVELLPELTQVRGPRRVRAGGGRWAAGGGSRATC